MKKSLLNDRELIQLFLSGDSTGFSELILRYKNKVFSIIMYMVRDRELADDLFQDTFLKALEGLQKGKYRDENKFSSWIGTIAHNVVIDHFRNEKTMPRVRDLGEISIFDKMKTSEVGYLEKCERGEIKRELREKINCLPKVQKEVLVMRMYGDLSFKEIADLTGVSINTALGRMRYALMNLREQVTAAKENIFQD